MFLGRHAINPVNGEQIPVYAADYVLADYGTGAIMAVPAHDQRDLDFARAHGVPVRVVIATGEPDPAETGVATNGEGRLVNSGEFDGLAGRGGQGGDHRQARRRRAWARPRSPTGCATGCSPDSVTGVRRSRSSTARRAVSCPYRTNSCRSSCPTTGYELRPADGESPLSSATDWVNVECPACGGPARRDTDTMDTFVDSSWYFLRYPNPDYTEGPFDPAGVARWLPVDEYIGGREHATGHLMYSRFITKVLYDLGMVPFVEPFTKLMNQGQVIMAGKAMSKTLGNLVNLQEQIAAYGPDAVRVTMVFAGPPEDDIDWADVSPTGAMKWLARVWRLTGDIAVLPAPAEPDLALRRSIHKLVAEATTAMDTRRLNVGISRLMELTNVLRRAVDTGAGPDHPTVREGAEALVRMLSCFAPFTAEEGWERLGHEPSIASAGWPHADPTLLVEDTVTCILQVDGKLRDRVDVPADSADDALTAIALASERVQTALAGATVGRVIVRAPKLVNVVTVSLRTQPQGALPLLSTTSPHLGLRAKRSTECGEVAVVRDRRIVRFGRLIGVRQARLAACTTFITLRIDNRTHCAIQSCGEQPVSNCP